MKIRPVWFTCIRPGSGISLSGFLISDYIYGKILAPLHHNYKINSRLINSTELRICSFVLTDRRTVCVLDANPLCKVHQLQEKTEH